MPLVPNIAIRIVFSRFAGLKELQNLLTISIKGETDQAFRPFSASQHGVLDLTDRTSDNLVIQAGNRSENLF
jgi:hypothetical protein